LAGIWVSRVSRFANRQDAGRELGAALAQYRGRDSTLVLALPRGGVPVAHEVARALNLPLDVWIVRKLGVPGHEELAMGAIALGEHQFIFSDVVNSLRVSEAALQDVLERETRELQRRERLYRGNRPAPVLKGATVLLVDDGVATGSSIRVAIQSLRALHARTIVVAVPTGPRETCERLSELADHVVCLWQPEAFRGVGQWYEDFTQTTDEEVKALLATQPWLEPERAHAQSPSR
jgi:putative phosphoribosyl transferase